MMSSVFAFAIPGSKYQVVSINAPTVLVVSFFFGLAVFSGYIQFTHERKSGTIVHYRKSDY